MTEVYEHVMSSVRAFYDLLNETEYADLTERYGEISEAKLEDLLNDLGDINVYLYRYGRHLERDEEYWTPENNQTLLEMVTDARNNLGSPIYDVFIDPIISAILPHTV